MGRLDTASRLWTEHSCHANARASAAFISRLVRAPVSRANVPAASLVLSQSLRADEAISRRHLSIAVSRCVSCRDSMCGSSPQRWSGAADS